MRIPVIFFTFFLILNCSKKEDNIEFYKALNDNIEIIIDTNTVFKYGKFYVAPQDSLLQIDKSIKTLKIDIKEIIQNSKKLKEAVFKISNKENISKEYIDILNNNNDDIVSKIDIKQIKKIKGIEYLLINDGIDNGSIENNNVGEICFFNSYFNENVGIIFYSKSSSIKTGSEHALFLKKEKNTWKSIKNIEISRW